MQRFLVYISILASLPLLTCSQKMNDQTHVNTLENLKKVINNLSKDKIMENGTLAFSLRDVSNQKVVFALNDKKTLNVASCMKTITTATALDILGKNYTYKTYLEYDGTIEGGVLQGNIYIRGTGDPTLASRFVKTHNFNGLMNTWVNKIKAKGIRKVEGRVIVDESYYKANPTPMGWIWGDMGNYYGAAAMPVNIMDNTYQLFFKPNTAVGSIAKVWKTKPILDIQFNNQVKIGKVGSGDNAYISSAPYSNIAQLEGTVPYGSSFAIKGAITDPALFLSKSFDKFLMRNNIRSSAPATTSRLLKHEFSNTNRKLLATHTSPNLSKIVSLINLFSINLYAEAVFKTISKQEINDDASTAAAKLVQEYWKNRGVDINAWYLQDGSGLSQSNGITANHLTHIFSIISKAPYFNDFYKSLPIAGVSGTMVTIGKNSLAYNNLRAKTGGMTRVLAYVGYFKTKDGKMKTFSLIANQYNCNYQTIKEKLSQIMSLMCSI